MPRTRPPSEMALLRYQIISAYLAMDPPRGQRGALLRDLASRTWMLPDGRELRFAAETLRGWIRAFRRDGLPALEDAPRPTPGVQVLDADVQALCALRRHARGMDITELHSATSPPWGVLEAAGKRLREIADRTDNFDPDSLPVHQTPP